MKLLLPILAVVTFVTGAHRAAAADNGVTLVVVVAKDAKISGLSRDDLKRAFSGDPVTAGGVRLVPFNVGPAAPARIAFDRAILGMSPSAVGRYWIDRRIRGGSGAPRALPSSAYVVKVVAKFPGAIGYLPIDLVTPAVKILAIDGTLPSDAAYPLAGR